MGEAGALLHEAGRPLRQLHFGQVVNILSAGSHHPLLCELEDDQGSAGLWVVKAPAVVAQPAKRGEFSVAAELVGAEVCAWAGVSAPALGLLRFPHEKTEVCTGFITGSSEAKREVAELFDANRGKLAFCCRFLEGAVDVRPGVLRERVRRPEVLGQAIALLLADAFIINHDRQRQNSNCLLYGQHLVAIDNGLTFIGLDDRGRRGEDLAQRTFPPTPLTQHIALPALQGRHGHPAWDAVTQRLEAVSDQTIESLIAGLPPELGHDHHTSAKGLLERLQRFLSARRAYAGALKDATLALVEAGP
jgi:hypothetical protein